MRSRRKARPEQEGGNDDEDEEYENNNGEEDAEATQTWNELYDHIYK